MRETELKAVVDDLRERRACVETAGATLVFAGRLEDKRYDMPDRSLSKKDVVLRVRRYRMGDHVTAQLDWKGPSAEIDGFKVREEIATGVTDPDVLETMLASLGYVLIRAIDREIVQYALGEATIRFERYPRMDILVEVEGTPHAIENAIVALALPRDTFLSAPLAEFVRSYETRTGVRAALCDSELAGDHRFSLKDA